MGSSPPAEAAACTIATITGPAGPLRIAVTRPAGSVRGTILVLPGRGEFVEKYRPVLAEIAGWGMAAAAFDWRGQGGSGRLLPDPRKGHVDDFAGYLDDLDTVLAHLLAEGLPAPVGAVGHSMGGHILLRAVAERATGIPRAALVAPMLDIELGATPRPLARLAASLAVSVGLGSRWAPGQGMVDPDTCRFAGNRLTADPAGFARWQRLLGEHPTLRIGGVTYGWLDAALRSIDHTFRPGYLERVTAPLLVVMAGEETIVRNPATRRAAARLARAETLVLDGARHDLFLAGPEHRARLMAGLRAFLAGGG
jgi:lysophospholipase